MERVFARLISGGRYYDAGDRLGYLKTVVDFGLAHEELGEEFGEYLKTKVGSIGD